MSILPCLLGFHRPGPWQDRISHQRPTEWRPHVRVSRKCGRRQTARRSVEPPFWMIRSRWRHRCGDEPRHRTGAAEDAASAATGSHMPTDPDCPVPNGIPPETQSPV